MIILKRFGAFLLVIITSVRVVGMILLVKSISQTICCGKVELIIEL
jgi:hypothetical protein